MGVDLYVCFWVGPRPPNLEFALPQMLRSVPPPPPMLNCHSWCPLHPAVQRSSDRSRLAVPVGLAVEKYQSATKRDCSYNLIAFSFNAIHF